MMKLFNEVKTISVQKIICDFCEKVIDKNEFIDNQAFLTLTGDFHFHKNCYSNAKFYFNQRGFPL